VVDPTPRGLADMDLACQVDAGCQVNKISHDTIMVDASTSIHYDMPTQYAAGLDNRAGEYHCASPDSSFRSNPGSRMSQR
jgi:hypothetical protein